MSEPIRNYFSDKELNCPHCGKNKFSPDLLIVLNSIRESVGRPIILTSAYRCVEHDLNIYITQLENSYSNGDITKFEFERRFDIEFKKERTSSHIKGLAVDIAVGNSYEREELLREIFQFVIPEINRVGIAKSFIHIDLDGDKPGNVCWLYKV